MPKQQVVLYDRNRFLFFYKNTVFRPSLNILVSLPVLGWNYSCEYMYSYIMAHDVSVSLTLTDGFAVILVSDCRLYNFLCCFCCFVPILPFNERKKKCTYKFPKRKSYYFQNLGLSFIFLKFHKFNLDILIQLYYFLTVKEGAHWKRTGSFYCSLGFTIRHGTYLFFFSFLCLFPCSLQIAIKTQNLRL